MRRLSLSWPFSENYRPPLLRNPDYTWPLTLCRIAGDLVAVRIGHNDCAIDVRVGN